MVKITTMYAGIAWHPDPAQSSESVQLVTASADKTARFFSGEGKQLGILQVSKPYPLNAIITTGFCCWILKSHK